MAHFFVCFRSYFVFFHMGIRDMYIDGNKIIKMLAKLNEGIYITSLSLGSLEKVGNTTNFAAAWALLNSQIVELNLYYWEISRLFESIFKDTH